MRGGKCGTATSRPNVRLRSGTPRAVGTSWLWRRGGEQTATAPSNSANFSACAHCFAALCVCVCAWTCVLSAGVISVSVCGCCRLLCLLHWPVPRMFVIRGPRLRRRVRSRPLARGMCECGGCVVCARVQGGACPPTMRVPPSAPCWCGNLTCALRRQNGLPLRRRHPQLGTTHRPRCRERRRGGFLGSRRSLRPRAAGGYAHRAGGPAAVRRRGVHRCRRAQARPGGGGAVGARAGAPGCAGAAATSRGSRRRRSRRRG
jgi:hypothetical protein